MIHEMSSPPDERAAAEAVYRHLTGAIGDLDPAHEAKRIAEIACRAARPKMWLRLTQEIDELQGQLASRTMASGGLCPHCGQRL